MQELLYDKQKLLENGDKMAMGMMDAISASSFDVSTGMHIGYYRTNDVNYLAAFAGGNTYPLLELAGGLVGNLYQVVLKLDVDASGNETLTAWYAADGDLTLTPGLAATDVGDIWQAAGDLDTFTLQTQEGGESNVQLGRFDEMRFGTSVADVTQAELPEDLDSVYIALTDSFSVELFASNGVKTATFSLTGSGAADGTNLISVAYGNFRTNGTELIVLRDNSVIEYYADPSISYCAGTGFVISNSDMSTDISRELEFSSLKVILCSSPSAVSSIKRPDLLNIDGEASGGAERRLFIATYFSHFDSKFVTSRALRLGGRPLEPPGIGVQNRFAGNRIGDERKRKRYRRIVGICGIDHKG